MTESLIDGAAVPLPIRATAVVASAVVKAARQLLTDLERGRRVDAAVLRNAMEAAFAASDASGAWKYFISLGVAYRHRSLQAVIGDCIALVRQIVVAPRFLATSRH